MKGDIAMSHEFSILVDTDLLEYFMRKHGADEEDIADMHEYVEPFERLDADKTWIIAKTIWLCMEHEQKVDFIRCYGADDEDEVIGHVADEILESCCRLVLD